MLLALDVSGSMGTSMRELVNTTLATVDALVAGSSLRVLVFDDEVREVLPSTQAGTATHAS